MSGSPIKPELLTAWIKEQARQHPERVLGYCRKASACVAVTYATEVLGLKDVNVRATIVDWRNPDGRWGSAYHSPGLAYIITALDEGGTYEAPITAEVAAAAIRKLEAR